MCIFIWHSGIQLNGSPGQVLEVRSFDKVNYPLTRFQDLLTKVFRNKKNGVSAILNVGAYSKSEAISARKADTFQVKIRH